MNLYKRTPTPIVCPPLRIVSRSACTKLFPFLKNAGPFHFCDFPFECLRNFFYCSFDYAMHLKVKSKIVFLLVIFFDEYILSFCIKYFLPSAWLCYCVQEINEDRSWCNCWCYQILNQVFSNIHFTRRIGSFRCQQLVFSTLIGSIWVSGIICGLFEKHSQDAHKLYFLLLYTDLHIKRYRRQVFEYFTACLFEEHVHWMMMHVFEPFQYLVVWLVLWWSPLLFAK